MRYVEYLWAVRKGKIYFIRKGKFTVHSDWFDSMGWPNSEYDRIVKGSVEVDNQDKKVHTYYHGGGRSEVTPNEVVSSFIRKYNKKGYSVIGNPLERFGMRTKDPMAHPKANPITSAEQYGLMAAIASGATLRQDVGISQELAREMIRKTPRRLRSKFATELAKKRTRNTPISNAYHHAYYFTKGSEGSKGNRIPYNTIESAISEYDKSNREYKSTQGDYKKIGAMLAKYLGEEVTLYDAMGYYIASFGGRKKNPSAEELTETWHGRPPEEVIDFEEEERHESDAAVLAELEELAILLENGEDTICIEFGEDPPMLVANVSTGSLELLGGDQHLEFGEGWDTSKSEISIGHVYLIAYCTDKHHLEGSTGKPESYEHFFGEEYYKSRGYKITDYKDTATHSASDLFFDDILEDGIVEDAIEAGYLPTMIYDIVNEKVKLVGGRYTVEDVGLRD